ncbi:hypothetical protein BKA60DRAFT_554900 [Fusarium oxysporum]|nr:hypothetical protein BKA60DRAFT_554900 [Fusarium oxysporum]
MSRISGLFFGAYSRRLLSIVSILIWFLLSHCHYGELYPRGFVHSGYALAGCIGSAVGLSSRNSPSLYVRKIS